MNFFSVFEFRSIFPLLDRSLLSWFPSVFCTETIDLILNGGIVAFEQFITDIGLQDLLGDLFDNSIPDVEFT